MISLVWLIPAFPLAAFLVNGLFGRRWLGHLTGVIASVAVGLSALVSIGVFLEVLGGKTQTVVRLYRWIAVGDFSINVSALVDPLSSTMLLVVTVVSFLIFVYSNGYMAHDAGFYRFFTWLSLFVFAMLILVMADNYLLMFVGWEGVGLCSYLLIGFWFERPAPYYAAKKAFVMNRIGDWLHDRDHHDLPGLRFDELPRRVQPAPGERDAAGYPHSHLRRPLLRGDR